jgi:maltose phosphorylase
MKSSLSAFTPFKKAAKLDKMDINTFYQNFSFRFEQFTTKKLKKVVHITSMAGTWMSIVEGFGGMRVKNDTLHFEPKSLKEWNGYSFKIGETKFKSFLHRNDTQFSLEATKEINVIVNGKEVMV